MRHLIHATSALGQKLIRDNQTSRWRLQEPDGSSTRVTVINAAVTAARWSVEGGVVQTGLPGSGRFDNVFEDEARKLRAQPEGRCA